MILLFCLLKNTKRIIATSKVSTSNVSTSKNLGAYRRKIESFVCSSEGFRGDYEKNDTLKLRAEFDSKVASGAKSVFVLASRHFSNLNHIARAHQAAIVKKEINRDYEGHTSVTIIKDQNKVYKLRNTFNGPALIPNLLPPSSYIVRRKDHPSLQSRDINKSWKDVAGKLEAISEELPSYFQVSEYDLIKARDQRINTTTKEKFIKEFIESTLSAFSDPKCYPGGTKELYERTFSLYRVDVIRSSIDNKVRGYKVIWLDDYTNKSKSNAGTNIWSPKSIKSTIGIADYNVYVHEDGATFAAWVTEGSDPIRKQVAAYEQKQEKPKDNDNDNNNDKEKYVSLPS